MRIRCTAAVIIVEYYCVRVYFTRINAFIMLLLVLNRFLFYNICTLLPMRIIVSKCIIARWWKINLYTVCGNCSVYIIQITWYNDSTSYRYSENSFLTSLWSDEMKKCFRFVICSLLKKVFLHISAYFGITAEYFRTF